MLKSGQYFTTNALLQDVMYNFIFNNPERILEPCVGRGHLVQYVQSKIPVHFDCYELDDTLSFVIPKKDITFCDFLEVKTNKKYKTILCNPPYYACGEFILKCLEMLDYKGEFIFIVPCSFFHTESSRPVLQKIFKMGRFTHLMYIDNKKMFDGIEMNIMICRVYHQSSWSNEIWYNETTRYAYLINGYLQITSFPLSTTNIPKIKDVFDCYQGCECGYKSVFKQILLGNIFMRDVHGDLTTYILTDEFPTSNKYINNHLLHYKNELIKRKDGKKWFEWKDTTNIDIMEKYEGSACIYIKLKGANKVAVKGHVHYFENDLLMLIPRNKKIKLKDAVAYFNSRKFLRSFDREGSYIIDTELFKSKPYTIN